MSSHAENKQVVHDSQQVQPSHRAHTPLFAVKTLVNPRADVHHVALERSQEIPQGCENEGEDLEKEETIHACGTCKV